jgi:hypothetical protein
VDEINLSGNRLLLGDALTFEINEDYDTYIVDPPFDQPDLWNIIPVNKRSTDNLILFSAPDNYLDGVSIALARGWTPSFEFIWDGCASEKKKNAPLLRHRSIKVFGPKIWNYERALLCDGIPDRIRKNYKHLQTVYSENYASSGRSHIHAKPVKLMTAVFGGLESNKILDYFAGSGNMLFASIASGANYTGIEINEEYYNQIIRKHKYEYKH